MPSSDGARKEKKKISQYYYMYLLKYDFVNVSLMHDYSSSLFFVPDLFQPKEDSVEASSVLKSIIGQGKTALFLFSKTTTRVTPLTLCWHTAPHF